MRLAFKAIRYYSFVHQRMGSWKIKLFSLELLEFSFLDILCLQTDSIKSNMNWGTRLTSDHLGNSGPLVLLSQMVCIIIHIFYGASRHQLRLLIKNRAAVMLPEPRLISVFYERLCRIESIEMCLHWKACTLKAWNVHNHTEDLHTLKYLHIQQCPNTPANCCAYV